jgi:hypothetical protein
MNGQPWMVGDIPHSFRIRLMQKHLGSNSCGLGERVIPTSRTSITHSPPSVSADLTDPICPEIFNELWVSIANSNSAIYNDLDGDASYDRCRTLAQYRLALSSKPMVDTNDVKQEVISRVSQLRGFLVLWPIRFLEEEGISMTHSVAKELFV